MLFVPPCGRSFEVNERLRLYYCPARRKHRNDVRHLGIYAGKAVRSIGEVAKVVVCSIDPLAGTVRVVDGDGPLTPDEENRILQATIEARIRDWHIENGHRFYLCDRIEPTDFQKTSPQGLRNRRYFDLSDVLGGDVPDRLGVLAESLRDHTWN